MQLFISHEDYRPQVFSKQNFVGITNSDQTVFDSKPYLMTNFSVLSFERKIGLDECLITIDGIFTQDVLQFLLINKLKIVCLRNFSETSQIIYTYQNCIILKNTILTNKNRLLIAAKIFYNDNITEYISKTCRANFGDSRCGVNLKNYTRDGIVSEVLSAYSFKNKTPIISDSLFNFSSVTFTSGSNNQITYSVRFVNNDIINLFNILKYELTIGDTYKLRQSCQKTYSACKQYNNEQNFRGF